MFLKKQLFNIRQANLCGAASFLSYTRMVNAYLLLQDRPGSRGTCFDLPPSNPGSGIMIKTQPLKIYQRSLGSLCCEHLRAVSAGTLHCDHPYHHISCHLLI